MFAFVVRRIFGMLLVLVAVSLIVYLIFIQWWSLVKQLFTAKLVSYSDQTNVVSQIKQGLPATFSLSIGAGIIWFGFGVLVGTISAVTAGRFSDRVITGLAL